MTGSAPHPDLPHLPPLPKGPAPFWAKLLRRPWPPIDVLVLKKADCPLCNEALALLRRARRRLGARLRVFDITERPPLLEAYGHEVPVVFIAGRKRFFGRVDQALLAREVDGARRRAGL